MFAWQNALALAVLSVASPTSTERTPSPAPAQERASAIDVEFALRRAAVAENGFSREAFEEELADRAAVPWRLDLAVLDGKRRIGRRDVYALDWMAARSRVRPAIAAEMLHLIDESSSEFDRVIEAGLASPHRALRRAALRRLAYRSAESSDLLTAGTSRAEFADEDEVRRFFARLGLRADAARVLLGPGAAPRRVLRDHFRDWIRLPIDAEGIVRLRRALPAEEAAVEHGAADALALVAKVRDRAEVEADLESILRLLDVEEVFAVDVLRDLGRALERVPEGLARDDVAALGAQAVAIARDPLSSELARERAAALFARLSPTDVALRAGIEFDETAAYEILDVVDERPGPFEPDAIGPWARDDRPAVRDTAASIVGRRYRHGGERALEPLVVSFLRADSAELRSRAFGWLAREDAPESVVGALRDAWERADEETRSEWLGRIPRETGWGAFRGLVLGELRSARRPDVSAIELVRGYGGDDEVTAAAAERLERATREIESADDYGERLLFDGLAAGLAHALDGAALDVVEDGLRRTMGLLHHPDAPASARPKFPKSAVALIAASDPNRVAWLLALDAGPRRVRFEAALQIAERADDVEPAVARRAASVLIEHYGAVDGTLRMRAVQALGRLPRDVASGRIAAFAADVASDLAPESMAAIDVLASHGEVGRLAEFIAAGLEGRNSSATELEVARRAASQIVRAGGTPEALELFERARGLDLDGTSVRSATEAVTGTLLQALATAAPRDDAARAAVFRAILERPLMSAASDLRARFAGDRLPEASFRWRYELEAFEALAQAGLDSGAFEGADDWPVVDGRLLLAFGLRAKDPALRVRLSRSAVFALQGERAALDTPRRVAEARLGLADALDDGRLDPRERVAVLCELLADIRTGALSGRVAGAVLGTRAGRSAEVHAQVAVLRWRASTDTKWANPRVESAVDRWERAAPRLP